MQQWTGKRNACHHQERTMSTASLTSISSTSNTSSLQAPAVLTPAANTPGLNALTPIVGTPIAASGSNSAKTNGNDIEKEDSIHSSTSALAPVLTGVNTTSTSTSTGSKFNDDAPKSASIQPVTIAALDPMLSMPNGLKLPKVSGAGLMVSEFQSISSANTANDLFKVLSGMDLGKIASTISQDQLMQLANKFGADTGFQNLVQTGKLPSAPPPAPVSLAPPVVKGSGLDGPHFSALLNAANSNALFTQVALQNLDQITSHISQTQLNQIFDKFGTDPAFQSFVATGSPPKALSAADLNLQNTSTQVSNLPTIELVGTHTA